VLEESKQLRRKEHWFKALECISKVDLIPSNLDHLSLFYEKGKTLSKLINFPMSDECFEVIINFKKDPEEKSHDKEKTEDKEKKTESA
jgi:hypothetical protein